MPAHLREEIIGTTEGLDGSSEAFRNLSGPSPAATLACPCNWCDGTEAIRASVPLGLTFLPPHLEIVTARVLPVFTEGAELDNASATVHLPRLADTSFPLGSVAHLALAQGMDAGRPQERVAATDALLLMAAHGSLDPTRLGRDLAVLAGCGTLKLGRLTESLSLAAQGGGHHTVALVLTETLHGLLPAPGAKVPAGLAALLNLAAECAERTASTPPMEGIAELAARKGSSLFLKAARRLHAACAAPA